MAEIPRTGIPGAGIPEAAPVLAVRDLRIDYRLGSGRTVQAVRGVDFDLYPGQSLALVGESGSGKSTLAMGLLRLLPRLGEIAGGSVVYRYPDGAETDVLALAGDRLRQWRWREAAMVFQGAMNAFNPVLRIGEQFADTMRAHAEGGHLAREDVRERAAQELRAVRLEPQRVLRAFPHELSGGMRQRALIALAMVLEPRILVLDEPTTALDLLTQRAIVDMLHELRAERGFALVFVSHDLALAAELADQVATMYAGRVIESGRVRELFSAPRHPYTAGLIKAVPPVRAGALEPASIPGAPPDLARLPPGCSFAARCGYAADACRTRDPQLEPVDPEAAHDAAAGPAGERHLAACLRWREVRLRGEEGAAGEAVARKGAVP